MTEQQINQIVENIRGISESPYIMTGTITGISLNSDNIEHVWTISTEKNSVANYSVKVDSLDDVLNIVHLFSGDPKESIANYFSNKFSSVKENYLNYSKMPKGV